MKNSVILLSGGLDSTTLLYCKAQHIALALAFDYGQNHSSREISCAEYNCRKLGIELLVIRLPFFKYFRSALLDGGESIPEGYYTDANMKQTVVPFRNGILLSIACGIAESRGLNTVLIANHSGDHTIYNDCRPAFVQAMGEAMQTGTAGGVTIDAPFTNLKKQDIVKLGTQLGVPYDHTYSCYKGGRKHCGKCGTCQERKEAFALAGVTDKTIYEDV